MTKIADPHLGLDRHARTLLALLSDHEPTFAIFDEKSRSYDVSLQTFPYFTGSRRWACIAMHPHLRPEGYCQVVAFGRDTLTEEIVVEIWPWEYLGSKEVPQPDEGRGVIQRKFPSRDVSVAADYVIGALSRTYFEKTRNRT